MTRTGARSTRPRSLPYDTLIVAVGSVTNDFGTPGAAEFAIPLETPEQASRFNRRLVNACLRAQNQTAPITPGQLHVAIIGAGATGTELAAELHQTARDVIAYGLDRIDPERDLNIVLIEAADRILPALPARISEATKELLEQDRRRGARRRAGRRGARGRRRARERRVHRPDLVVWAAGVKAPPSCATSTAWRPTGSTSSWCARRCRRRATTMSSRSATARPARGPAIRSRSRRAPRPPIRWPSSWSGRSSNILAGRPLKEFVYRDFGSLVSLGHYSTVGSLMGSLIGRGVFIEGYFARLMYRSLYKMHEAALHGRARTLLGLVAPAARPRPTVKLH